MAEYIDREALIKDLKQLIKENNSLRYALIDDDFIDIVKDAPTADVVLVRHGKWRRTEESLGFRDVDCIECSACKEEFIIDEDFHLEEISELWRYCPRCGSKMYGKDEDNESNN